MVIVGDVLHSRVARSNVAPAAHPGRRGGAGGAADAAARRVSGWPVTVSHDLDAELPVADAVLMLRVQAERMTGGFFPSLARVLGALRAVGEAAGAAARATPWCCTPDRCCAAWRSRHRSPTRRNRLCCNRFPTVCISGWRCCSTCWWVRSRRRSAHERVLSGGAALRRGRPVSTCWSTTARSPTSARTCPSPMTPTSIDATGQILLPGFVDLHTHLREPGREYAEDIETGSAAAALGGYTAVFAMANTNPVADSPVVTDHVWHRGQQVGLVDVHPGRCGHHGPGRNAADRDGNDGRRRGQVRMFSDDGICVARPAGDAPRAGVRHRTGCADRPARRGAAADRRRRRARGPQRRAPRPVGLAARRRGVDRRARRAAGPRRGRAGAHLPRLDRRHRRDRQMGQGTRHFDHRRGDAASPAARRQPAGHLRRTQPGQPAAARVQRRRGAAPGTRRRRHRLRGHRPRAARRAREDVRVRQRPARHARPADGAVGGRRDDGAHPGCSRGATSRG